ncbi:hypothetical protein Q5424_07190 [Conexibacter sp. JD483]|uniref:hypothetical protein n=1 Tax=unclassified Conexibacter TaxID=2627773 RepID=UPI002717451D|nr:MULTISPECIES: hypothetical protein [unclassified Conexibacter]MDO8187171.1 hypothetical protein [Conexibacter sp. CPCC 205706]MDO8200347.1 hypothetical protein [Conexibacter sp. CPCC 205762]MDR9368857.1 hypothetical protein [Conexibacter sp. JD483]
MVRLRPLATAAAVAALALAGCGSVGDDRPEVDATIVLDGPPQAYDAPIAAAAQRDFDGAEGVQLRMRRPRGADEGIRALFRRRADFVVIDADRLTANPRLVGVMALVNAPDGDRAPRIVLATSRARLAEQPNVAKATVAAILRGYEQTQVDPESSLSDLQTEFEGLDRTALTAQYEAVEQQLFPPGRPLGALPQGDRRYDTTVVANASKTTHPS